MKKKSLFYLGVGILGIVLMALAFALDGKASDAADGTLMGVGAGFTGVGVTMWRFFHWGMKNPAKRKQYEIESHDERNVVIRLRAQAAAGEALQWTVLAAAWAAILLDAPLWVILAAVGVFLFKTILEICLTARYQKEM